MSTFQNPQQTWNQRFAAEHYVFCLLYTSDAADEGCAV
jgi:hypothetical protein